MSAFYFMFYEYFKGFCVRNDAATYIKRVKHEDIEYLKELQFNISFTQSLLCSALAGALASFITNPLDLVKLRMQVQRAGGNVKLSDSIYKNMFQGVALVYSNEGFKGLFSGSIARISHATPTTAISMCFLETVKPHVRKRFEQEY